MTNQGRDLGPDKRREFLEQLDASHGNVSATCRAIGISRQCAYQWRKDDPVFAAEWEEVYEHATELLEAEAFRRASEGQERVYYDKDGNVLRSEQVASDPLLIFLLKARLPQKYKDKATVEHTGKDGGPLEVIHVEGAADSLRQKLAPVIELRPTGTDPDVGSNGNGHPH